MEIFDPNSPMPDFQAQMLALERQRKMADTLRTRRAEELKQSDPGKGQMIGKFYVPPAMAQRVAHLIDQIGSGKGDRDLAANDAATTALQAQYIQKAKEQDAGYEKQAQEWRASLPQAVAAKEGMPANFVMATDEGRAGTPDIAAQPITSDRVLKHTLAARGNPKLKEDADLYSRSALAELAREDAQVQATALAREAQAARAQDRQEQRDWQTGQNETYKRTAADQTRMLTAAMAARGGNGPRDRFSVQQGPNGMYRVNLETGEATPITMKGADGAQLAKPVNLTAAQQKAYDDSEVLIGHIDNALEELKVNPDAVGAKGYLPNAVLTRMDPKGVRTRAAVGGLSAEKVHQLSGAAVSPMEFKRLEPYLPSLNDDATAAAEKLANLKREMLLIKASHAKGPTARDDGAPASPPGKTVVREVKLKDGRTGVEYSDGTRGFK